MKKLLYIFFLNFILFNYSNSQDNYTPLFKIYENGLYGYIDSTGKVVIPAKYKNAGDFSEGLAPVRENGTFGYVDQTGTYFFKPIFDYAESFKHGFAKVYVNGFPNFINRTGEKIISFECNEIFPFENDKAIVKTNTRKTGVIDKNGILIIDTIYSEIFGFKEGLSVVKFPYEQYGVIDTLGNMIVPFGKYRNIHNFYNGFAKVTWKEGNDNTIFASSQGFINSKGELVFSLLNSFYIEISEMVSEDSLFIISEYEYGYKGKVGWTGERIYGGLMNIRSEVVCFDSLNYRFGFLDNKLCTIDTNNRYAFVDRNGRAIGTRFFYYANGTKQMFSFAGEKDPKKEKKFGLIDTSLAFLIEPFFELKHYTGIIDDYFIYGKYLTDENDNYIPSGNGANISKLGICRIDGKLIHEPAFDEVDYNGYVNGLFLVVENGKLTYINKRGKNVWSQKNLNSVKSKKIDIDYQLSTRYTNGYYGWTPSISEPINDNIKNLNYSVGTLSLIISVKEKTLFNKVYEGFSLYLINDFDHAVSAPSVDGALYLVLQAKDINGNWRSVESYPSSSCGNSYFPTSIYGKYYKKFSIPKYYGECNTVLRVLLKIYNENKDEINIYSNEISGSVNPAQFWRVLPYFNSPTLLDRQQYIK